MTTAKPADTPEAPADKPQEVPKKKTRVWGAVAIGAVINKTTTQTF